MLMHDYIRVIGGKYRKILRNYYDRRRLNNYNFSILSNDCSGGVISHDLGCEFLSPTVNLFISPTDFVKFMENVKWYLNQEMVEEYSTLGYPVAKLADIHLYMVHYNTFEEARNKWNERKNRINFDNLYVIMSDRYCLPQSYYERFQNLPYSHKVLFSIKGEKEFSCVRIIKKNNDKACVGILSHIQNVFGKRLYQYAKNWDYVSWLNNRI